MNKPRLPNKRSKAEKRGRRSEGIAALWLQLKGYRILERRYKTKLGEIDLIAKKRNLIAFVEVKQRQDLAGAYESLSAQSLIRIQRSADQFISRRAELRNCDLRFDVVFVLPRLKLKHIRDAWRTY